MGQDISYVYIKHIDLYILYKHISAYKLYKRIKEALTVANEKLQDVILDQDTLINYGDGEKPIKEFFKGSNSPVVIVKDMYGEAVEAVNLVEFEECMQQEAAEAEEGRNFNIANDYDILYKDMQNGKESYHCYKCRYTVGELDIVKNIKDNFSVQEGSCAMENFPQYIDKQYQSCVLDERKKAFAVANEKGKFKDVILDQDKLIDDRDGEKKPIKDFFKDNDAPLVVVKDVYGDTMDVANLLEFEKWMQIKVHEAESGTNLIANYYDILYKHTQDGKENYHSYKGRYATGELNIVKNIKDNFSIQESSCAIADFPQYIEKQYQVCELAERQKEEARMAKRQKIEDKIAELEKEGLAEPRIIFLDEKHYCEDILLKEIEKAEIQDKYYDILEGIDCLILYKDQDKTRRVHLKEQEDMGPCSYNEEHNEEPYVDYRTLTNLLFDNHPLNQYANYMPLKKYMLDNLPSLREPRVVFSSYSCINHTLYDNYGKEFLDRKIRKNYPKCCYLSQLKPKDLVSDHIDFTIYSNTYSGTDRFSGEVNGYEKLEDVDMRKVFADIKACIADCEHKYGDNEYGDKEVLYQYIDKNIIPKLPKESIMKRVKRKTRLILNLVQDKNRDDGRSRER